MDEIKPIAHFAKKLLTFSSSVNYFNDSCVVFESIQDPETKSRSLYALTKTSIKHINGINFEEKLNNSLNLIKRIQNPLMKDEVIEKLVKKVISLAGFLWDVDVATIKRLVFESIEMIENLQLRDCILEEFRSFLKKLKGPSLH